jgi:glyoxylase-like metal-dependent hydrolase (beta-lactamase superfamily II)
VPLGLAEPTMLRIRETPGEAQRKLREEDARHYVERDAPLGLGQVQSLPVPGRLDLGDQELELHPAEGHAPDGMAIFAPWCGVLACGDYLSNVEIPLVAEAGSPDDYRATLARLAPLVERAETVVPGHGGVHTRGRALELLDQDLEYLDALERGQERVRLPEGRDTPEQRRIHADNLRKHASS